MPAPHRLTTRVQTRFADLDPLGHVNHIAFFTYMETARVAWMDGVRDAVGRVLVARSSCDHRAEIRAAVKAVDVTVQAESVGRTSFTVRQELAVDGTLVGLGTTVLVAVDHDHRPTPLDAAARALLLGGA